MTSRCAIIGLAALAAGVLFGQAAAVAASAEKGKQAFFKNGCWQCHGYLGQGGVTGFKLAPDPIPYETLQTFVRTTNRNMPRNRRPADGYVVTSLLTSSGVIRRLGLSSLLLNQLITGGR